MVTTMNQLTVPKNFGPVAKIFEGVPVEDDLSAGIQAGFGIISFRGKVWRIKFRGEEKPIMRADGDGPANSVEVVIVKAAPNLSKIFYINGYEEGSTAPPDCFSTNGQVPDPASPKLQCSTCAACPQNVWGSKITPAGKKGKACADSKRLAVVPLGDIENSVYGGPMLLRVPAASLQDIAAYGTKLKGLGYPTYSVATRISFDTNEAFPKFVVGAIRPLTEDEATKVMELRESDAADRIISTAVDMVHHEPEAPKVEDVFEQPPQEAPKVAQKAPEKAPEPPPSKVVQMTPKATTAPLTTAAPVVTPTVTSSELKEELAAPTQPTLQSDSGDEDQGDQGAMPDSLTAELDAELEALMGK